MVHSTQQTYTYGENLFSASASGYTYFQGTASDSWYSEIVNYDFQTGQSKNGGEVGHFTAMIWKSAEKVGFGYAIGNIDGWDTIYVVARYTPPTNIIGQEVANVGLPIQDLLG